MSDRPSQLTEILRRGDEPGEELFALVYDELRAIAQKRMGGERAEHTLRATALVHEAYLRLLGDERSSWRDRGHFYAASAEAMRRILIDHARRVQSQKGVGASSA